MEILIVEGRVPATDYIVESAIPVETSSKKYLKKIIKNKIVIARKSKKYVFQMGQSTRKIWFETNTPINIFTINEWIKKRKLVEKDETT